MTTAARAPGKLILLGEYAVLEGAPAIVVAVNRYARVKISPRQSDSYFLSAPTLGLQNIPFKLSPDGQIQFLESLPEKQHRDLQFFMATLENTQRFPGLSSGELSPMHITLDTSDFFFAGTQTKLGLGSSAALTVALTAGILHMRGIDFSTENHLIRLFQTAMKAHRIAQANVGSGVDIAASVFGGVLKYKTPNSHRPSECSIEKLTVPPDLFFLPIWTGKAASTRALIAKVHRFKRDNAPGFRLIMQDLCDLAREGCSAFSQKKVTRFLEIVQQYHQTLCELGRHSKAAIFSKVHQKISRIAQKYGAVYKSSGAGGGDFGIAFSRSEESLNRLYQEIKSSDFKIFDLKIEPIGVKFDFHKSWKG